MKASSSKQLESFRTQIQSPVSIVDNVVFIGHGDANHDLSAIPEHTVDPGHCHKVTPWMEAIAISSIYFMQSTWSGFSLSKAEICVTFPNQSAQWNCRWPWHQTWEGYQPKIAHSSPGVLSKPTRKHKVFKVSLLEIYRSFCWLSLSTLWWSVFLLVYSTV